VSFEVPAGSIFGLLGPNGAGKTTLFSIIANFLRADAGKVDVLGIDARKTSALQGRLTILPQDALFQRNLSILDQLMFFRRLAGQSKAQSREDAIAALKMVGLAKYARRSARVLSHGMTKRLGIAQAFLGRPEVILLDEPTAGLDPKNARQIRDLVQQFRDRDCTIVVSSHNLAEIQELCDHVAILDHGKLVAAGPVAEIAGERRELKMRLSRDLEDNEVEALNALSGVADVRRRAPLEWSATLEGEHRTEGDESADEVHPQDAAMVALLRALLDFGVTPREWREGATLEEHFLRVTDKKKKKSE
jgi:ABC-type multidrug transport system ATPase subunit